MLRRRYLFPLISLAVAVSTIAGSLVSRHADGYEIVHTYPHDSQAFTQGLIFVDGHLYESTGLKGKSSLRMVDLSTGKALQKYDLPLRPVLS